MGDREIAVQLSIGHHAMKETIATLEYWKCCPYWAPCLLMNEYKYRHMAQLFQHHPAEATYFLSNAVTGDNS
jgi:hypothetical protein